MFETIAYGLISTALNYLFDTAILRRSTVEIEGAPYWYEQKGGEKAIYVSAYCDGGLEALDCAKRGVKEKLVIIIDDAFDRAVEKKFKHYEGQERTFVEEMRDDTDLPHFVERHTVFQNLKYDEDDKRAFARGYVTLDALQRYENERIDGVRRKVLNYHYDEMMQELDEDEAQ